ncbi:apolipoprotein N-acyltransferase [Camelimonas sp. ID_303_24]
MTALVAGAIGALSLAPVDFLPAMFIALTTAVWLVDAAVQGSASGEGSPGRRAGQRARAAAALGWWFGFGYFVAGLWWLGAAFLVEADEFAWALPLGVLGLPAGLAFFTAAGFGLAGALWSRGPVRILTLAGALGVSEYLRGVLFSGFPWNTFGMALGGHSLTAQIASIVGMYGLTVLTVAICAAPATLAPAAGETTGAPRDSWLRRLAPTGMAAIALAALVVYGHGRIPGAPAMVEPGIRLRLVQPGVSQDTTVFNWENREKILSQYIRLSEGEGAGPTASQGAGQGAETGLAQQNITHVIWPESALPFLLADHPQALAAIGDMLPPGAVLITGAARGEALAPGGRPNRFYNSMQVVDHQGRITAVYDKSHLVPFGEYLPFSGALDALGLRQFVHIPGGFAPGAPGGGLDVPGLPPVTPLICYEAIFPGFGPARSARGVILNVTNDGWFGQTPGPWQHLAQARLRAIEQGLPLVRVANTGISVVVDSWGRTNTFLPLGKVGYADSALPSALQPTVYAKSGDLFFVLLLIFCFGCSARAGWRRDAATDSRQQTVG